MSTATRITSVLPSVDDVRKPVHAWVGVADYAIAQVKEVPSDVTTQAKKVQARVTAVPGQLKEIPSQVKQIPAQVKDFSSTVEKRASSVQNKATETYGSLAERGEKLIGSIRRQKTTQTAVAEGKTALNKAEAATRNAKRSAKAAGEAVTDAADKIG